MLALGHAVELHPDGRQQRRGADERGQVGVVGQQRRIGRDGAENVDVAQPAMTLFQVGLEQEGDVAGGRTAFGHLDLEHREVLGAEPVAPRRLGLLDEGVRQLALAPDHARIEQAEGHSEVLGGGTEHLGGPPHRVVEVHAFVPDRVPDGVGHGLDVPKPVVHEHHVEVAVGAEGAAPVAPNG